MDFSLFYFDGDGSIAQPDKYQLLIESAKFADKNGFSAIWTPEQHFHAFGGLYSNPFLTSAAIAMATQHIQLRAGSVVVPLHDPLKNGLWLIIFQMVELLLLLLLAGL